MSQLVDNTIKVFHTVKYLKPKQLFYQLYYRVNKLKHIESIPSGFAKWKWQGPRLNEQSILDESTVVFLNEEGKLEQSSDWNCQTKTKLWLYNLHYFDDLSSKDYTNRTEIHYNFISKWIDENPPCAGNGWEPYPTSLRLVNWVKWCSVQSSPKPHVLKSMLEQALVLEQQLEYHILGNHLFANAKALVFVGTYLEGAVAASLLKLGLKLLNQELKEQFLADGAHFELSPMYHEILLWDLLELIDLAKTSNNYSLMLHLNNWAAIAEKALSWLNSMLHPDEEISFFNDAAIGIAATPKDIYSYANKLGIKYLSAERALVTNSESGYSRVQNDKYTLLFDHANVGPDYLPGHAHADTLSFELSVGLHRFFVNSGTSLYGVSKERLRQRSTSAHNTVTVCDENSSEVWSGFRVARRAYAKLLKTEQNADSIVLSACHDGYKRLKPKVVHTRTLEAKKAEIIVTDNLSHNSEATFNLHIHPNVMVELLDNKTLALKYSSQTVELTTSHEIFVEKSTWHPEFGKSVENKKITIPFNDGQLITKIKVIKE
ncbi:alginate lyase family protein [Pseudoalteromonas sp. PAR1]|uniref:heparinase II/III family protein n=1 Tax=Pseudoalteromonas sp. PAR1 TaxID=2853443 RepID=UPI00248B44E0|nr:alginate lyase family protein [Pseudoalteromonas sp. PAR1]